MKHARLTTTCAGMAVAALMLTACGADGAPTATPSSTAEQSATPTPTPTPERTAPTSAASSDHPDWAYPATTPGDVIATLDVGELRVEVAQVGIVQASRDSAFVDATTGDLLFAEGDDLVLVNYVVTNTGADLNLKDSGIEITARYADWPYTGNTSGERQSPIFDPYDVHRTEGEIVPGDDREVFAFRAGQSFSVGDSYVYQPGNTMEFEARYVPVDEAGVRLHEQRGEGAASGVIA